MPLIKKDEHGLYVYGGSIYRPYLSKLDWPLPWHISEGKTKFKEGDKVSIRCEHGTARIWIPNKQKETTELWMAHGTPPEVNFKPTTSNKYWTPGDKRNDKSTRI